MLRRLFTVLSASSLLLCVAIVVLWMGCYGHPTRAKGRIGGHDYGIRSARGGVEVWRGWDPWDLMDSADPYRPLNSVACRLGIERAGSWDDNAGGFYQSRGLRFPPRSGR